jgi:hypothetical protein
MVARAMVVSKEYIGFMPRLFRVPHALTKRILSRALYHVICVSGMLDCVRAYARRQPQPQHLVLAQLPGRQNGIART